MAGQNTKAPRALMRKYPHVGREGFLNAVSYTRLEGAWVFEGDLLSLHTVYPTFGPCPLGSPWMSW